MDTASGYSPEEPAPLGSYAAMALAFTAGVGVLALAHRRSGRTLPDRIPASDLALLTIATHKLSRLITKARITSFLRAPFTRYEGNATAAEVSEKQRGSGLRRTIGQLLICPYCIGQWIGTGFTAAYLVQPRAARAVAAGLTISEGADFLQQAWAAAERSA